jgi:TRAP-type C4-dicarboxylate transport system substrate-binding protein
MMAAAADYTVNCAECLQEYIDAGFVFMGGGASSAYLLILKGKEVRTVEDLKGLKLRAGGPPNARWADALGASPVNVSVTETFEAMSQGVVDGTMAGISDLLAFRLMDIADSVTTVELGSPYSIANFSPTVSVWASLDEDERADYVRAATRANASFTGDWGYRLPAGATGAAKKAGIVFNAPDPSLVDAPNTFVQADIAALPEIAMVKFNIPDAAEKIAIFQEYVAKWDTLLGNESGDPEKVAAIMQREIWDKVDYGKYGL